MYHTDLNETEWECIINVLDLQERKRKYDLRLIWNAMIPSNGLDGNKKVKGIKRYIILDKKELSHGWIAIKDSAETMN